MREPARDPARDAALELNRRAWDRLATAGAPLTRPAADEAFADPRLWLGSAGSDDRAWLPARLDGLEVLCLAAGGGKHGPLYAAAGARVTVLDLSPAMLALDRAVATVFREVARVTRPGGLYISQHKSPASLQAGLAPNDRGRYELEHPQRAGVPLPDAPPSRLREAGCREHVHSLESLLGGICRAGFTIEDVAEPDCSRPAAGREATVDRAAYLPPYLRVLARRGGPRSAAGLVVVDSSAS